MAEILTESFCERCGSRFTFEAVAGQRRGLGRIRTLSRGLKNFVANDDASFSDAMALARDEDERKASAQQLDAFHRTFNFCMTCRQYTCSNCWNGAAGECLSCAPDLSRENLPDAFPDLTVVGRQAAHGELPEAVPPIVAASAWPSTDVRVDAAPPPVVAGSGSPAAGAVPDVTAEPEVAPESEAALAREPEVARAVEALAAAESAPEPVALLEPGAQAEAPVTVEAGLDTASGAAAEPAVPASARVDESDVELTPTELAAIEGVLHRRAQRAESAAAISAAADGSHEAGGTGQPEPVAEGRAETRRFFQRFRPHGGRPALPASAIPIAAPGEDAAITQVPAAEAAAGAAEIVAAAPELVTEPVTEPIAVEAAAPEPAAEPVAAEIEAAAPEPVVEPVAVAEVEPVAVEMGSVAPEVLAAAPEPDAEPVAVEAAAPEPDAEPVAAEAAASEPKPEPVDVVEQPTWRMVAPDGTATGDVEPASPLWSTPPSVTRRPAEPMPTTAWASRVATARPVESPVWAASSRDVLAPAQPGVAAAVGIHSCVSCGLSLSASARFCRRCGTRQG